MVSKLFQTNSAKHREF